MPEGDTVHNYATVIGRYLHGERLVAGQVIRPDADLAGRRVTEVTANGKHLLIGFDQTWVLRTHLGMNGSWHGYAPDEAWRRARHLARVILRTTNRVIVCFAPKEVELMRSRDWARRRMTDDGRGPDLMDHPDPAHLVERARRFCAPATGVAEVLLDQRVASGIGNVFKSEVLFLERLHPGTPMGALSDAQLHALLARAGELLRDNRGRSWRRTRRATGSALWVYGRGEQPCFECGAPIRRAETGPHRRGTWWCPACQGDAMASGRGT